MYIYKVQNYIKKKKEKGNTKEELRRRKLRAARAKLFWKFAYINVYMYMYIYLTHRINASSDNLNVQNE